MERRATPRQTPQLANTPPLAVFILGSRRRILFANPEGRGLLDTGTWFSNRGRRLVANPTTVNGSAVNASLDAALAGRSSTQRLLNKSDGRHAILTATPLPPGLRRVGSGNGTMAIACIIPGWDTLDGVARVAARFGLTPAEKNLLAVLSRTGHVRTAAAQLNVSIHTTRAQLKAIFAKTGRRSQPALLIMVARFSAEL